jgi:hypothetical protein
MRSTDVGFLVEYRSTVSERRECSDRPAVDPQEPSLRTEVAENVNAKY